MKDQQKPSKNDFQGGHSEGGKLPGGTEQRRAEGCTRQGGITGDGDERLKKAQRNHDEMQMFDVI